MTVVNDDIVIGIDLGSINSIVSYVDAGEIKHLTIRKNQEIPSVFYMNKHRDIGVPKELRNSNNHSEYIEFLIRTLEKRLNSKISKYVVASKEIDIGKGMVVEEIESILRYFEKELGDEEETVICDLGGNSLKLYLVEGTENIIATRESFEVSGEKVTEVLMEALNISYSMAEAVKREFSINKTIQLTDREVTISEFENIIFEMGQLLIREITSLCKDIRKIILLGGNSKIDFFSRIIEERLGIKAVTFQNSETLISIGALKLAKDFWKPSYERSIHDFGIEIEKFKFDPIIECNRELPIVERKKYILSREDSVKIFKRKSGSKAIRVYDDDIEYINELNIDKKDIQLDIEMELTNKYMLNINIKLIDEYGEIVSSISKSLKGVE